MRDIGNSTRVARSAEGHQELAQRTRGLSQRHRTVLLLADGKRELDQLLSIAAAAGADRSHFDELHRLGLIELIEPPAPPPAAPPPPSAPEAPAEAIAVDTLPRPTLPPVARPRIRPLERARTLLLDALKEYAPLTSTLLARRIRRAEDAREIEVLLDEAEAKMARTGTLVQASQVVRRARELLARED